MIVWVLGAFLLGTALVAARPSSAEVLALHAPLWSEPLNLLRIGTFSFVHLGAGHWLFVAVFVLTAALALKGRVDERWMLGALAGGAVAGAIAFGWSASRGVLVGGHVAAWGLAGAALGAFARGPGRFGVWRRAYVILLLLSAAGLVMSGRYPPLALVGAGVVGAAIGFAAPDPAGGREPDAEAA